MRAGYGRRYPAAVTLIRPATEADIAAVQAIYADAVATGTASFELAAPDAHEMGRRFAALRAGGFPYLVAERGGAVAGYAYAGPFKERAAYRSTVEDSVYVARAARGGGVGRALLAALIAACEPLDVRVMVAVIAQGASPASVALHARLGFAHAGMLEGVGYKHGRWLDVALMQRALGAGRSAPPTRG